MELSLLEFRSNIQEVAVVDANFMEGQSCCLAPRWRLLGLGWVRAGAE